MGKLWHLGRARAVRSARVLPFLAVETGASLISLAWLFVLIIMALATVPGWLALPWGVGVLRRHADVARRRVGRFSGRAIDSAYVPLTGNWFARAQVAFQDRATYRDLLWLVVHGLPGFVIGLVGVVLPLSALSDIIVPAYWWVLPADEPAAPVFEVTSWPLAFATMVFGIALMAVAILVLPALAAMRVWWTSRMLQPNQQALLTRRVSELTESRASALEAHGSELRRIERDLHDGTQNKLVGVVMHLGIVERSLGRSPDQVRPVLLKAQEAAETALAELRDVVRNIYPPVLDERGLGGALAAAVARCPVDTTLTTEGLRRAPIAVESAAYFVVSEALTNIAKHSRAMRAWVTVATVDDRAGDRVVIEVHDDGVGGATDDGGTGLPGIRRRVEAFEGVFEMTSPDGGPTTLHVEIPCG
ncbi:sensor histidine kinase [Solicola gregarius]|uniref:histidine kinase n=1 Tax=Solicola gregarius TaxID=2908642 RepID=A0AA46YJV6_9ACTN|nr:sensor histidine kinase [Solicola gregarius]UYM03896.1 sensor domain-containing protein [Solicola gregarius]